MQQHKVGNTAPSLQAGVYWGEVKMTWTCRPGLQRLKQGIHGYSNAIVTALARWAVQKKRRHLSWESPALNDTLA